MTLDKKYRPQTWDEVVGNVSVVSALKQAVDRSGSPFFSATLLKGPSGCGKTTLARLIADSMGARGLDLMELNISNMRGIDAARSIIDLMQVSPWGSCRFVILNECHKATNEFQNAMLEILEEPPESTYFILCTTAPEKLLKAIQNRCTVFTVTTVTQRLLLQHVVKIAKLEKINVSHNVLSSVASQSCGSVRQALVILDALKEVPNEADQLQIVMGYGGVDEASVFALYQALMQCKPWPTVAAILRQLKEKDPETVRYVLLSLLERDILNAKQGDRAAAMMDCFATSFSAMGRPGLTQACWLSHKA